MSYHWRGTEEISHIAVYQAPPGEERDWVDALENNAAAWPVDAAWHPSPYRQNPRLTRNGGRRFLIFARLEDGTLRHLAPISEGGAGAAAELRWCREDLKNGWYRVSLRSTVTIEPEGARAGWGQSMYALPRRLPAGEVYSFRLRPLDSKQSLSRLTLTPDSYNVTARLVAAPDDLKR
ncbi:MAG: hypothetical protein LBK56_09545 [Gracilibacteraceae bacterium]|nr:hypothetical protein [Gracilibacteraceae bacterium]